MSHEEKIRENLAGLAKLTETPKVRMLVQESLGVLVVGKSYYHLLEATSPEAARRLKRLSDMDKRIGKNGKKCGKMSRTKDGVIARSYHVKAWEKGEIEPDKVRVMPFE